MKVNGFEIKPGIVKDVIIVIGIIVSALSFILQGQAHIHDDDSHVERVEKAMLEYLVETNFQEWRARMDERDEHKEAEMKEFIRQTIKELKQEGLLN